MAEAPCLQLSRLLCLNRVPVPLMHKQMEFEDLHECWEGEDFEGEQDIECLSLKATMDAKFLEGPLKLGARWWVAKSHRVPLLQEIRGVIDKKKQRKGGASRLSKKANRFVAIQIRDKVILVQNTTNPVTLVAPEGSMEDTVLWFVTELQKDLQTLREEDEAGAPSCPSRSSKRKGSASGREQQTKECEVIEDALETLRQHPRCASANFSYSNNTFRVQDIDKKNLLKYVKGLAKAVRKADANAWEDFEDFEVQVNAALDMVLAFLNAKNKQDEVHDQDVGAQEQQQGEVGEDASQDD